MEMSVAVFRIAVFIAFFIVCVDSDAQLSRVSVSVVDINENERYVEALGNIWTTDEKIYFSSVGELRIFNGDRIRIIPTEGQMGLFATSSDGFYLDSGRNAERELYFIQEGNDELSDVLATRPEDGWSIENGLVFTTRLSDERRLFSTKGERSTTIELGTYGYVSESFLPEGEQSDFVLLIIRDSLDVPMILRTDGTQEGTFVLHEEVSEVFDSFILYEGLIYYILNNEVWSTDGTIAGTQKAPMPTTVAPYERIGLHAGDNGQLYVIDFPRPIRLFAVRGPDQPPEFLLEFEAIGNSGNPVTTTLPESIGGLTFFRNEASLWISDGTIEETREYFNPNTGQNYNDRWFLRDLVSTSNGNIYFLINSEEVNQYILYRFNGIDMPPIELVRTTSRLFDYHIGEEILYFEADADLYATNGTVSGTNFLGSFIRSEEHLLCSDRLQFIDGDKQFWITDGTAEGTLIAPNVLSDFNSGDQPESFSMNDNCLFYASDSIESQVFFVYNEENNSYEVLVDLFPHNSGSDISNLSVFQNNLVFTLERDLREYVPAVDEHFSTGVSISGFPLYQDSANHFYERDRTLLNVRSSPYSEDSIAVDAISDVVRFEDEFWFVGRLKDTVSFIRSDGTTEGTELAFNQIIAGDTTLLRTPNLLATTDELILFPNRDDSFGEELWATDGSAANTFLVKDIDEGSSGSFPDNFFRFHDQVLFSADNDLWASDGTESGTIFLSESTLDFRQGTVQIDDRLYYSSSDDGLWTTDGTADGTIELVGVDEMGQRLRPSSMRRLNNDILFIHTHDVLGIELWAYNIGSDTIRLVRDLRPVGSSSPHDFVFFQNKWFFLANDGTGDKIWFTDGTEAGTQVVDIDYSNYRNISDIEVFKNRLYFIGLSTVYSRELYFLDFTPEVMGFVFEDLDGDGEFDSDEQGLIDIPVEISGDINLCTFSSLEGAYSAFLEEGIYNVEVLGNECWEPAGSAISDLEVVLDSTINLDFAVIRKSDEPAVKLSLTSPILRCGFTSSIWFNVNNSGCSEISGMIERSIDSLVELVEHIGFQFENDNAMTISVPSLFPGESISYQLVIKLPSEEFVGEFLDFDITGSFISGLGQEINDSFSREIVLRCAIDPNDKLVFPNRQDEGGNSFTQFDEQLEYTIRFQNTGNDTAFTVVILDTLSSLLDANSIQSLSSSHDFVLNVFDDSIVEFRFENILLPDSTTNEPASNGFVQFLISSVDNIGEGDVVENDAAIFFDFNRPIITNSVVSTFVEHLDQDMDGFNFYEECDDLNPLINPNATEIVAVSYTHLTLPTKRIV